MNASVRVTSILDRFPDVESILALYDVSTSDIGPTMTIENLCDKFEIDIEDLLMDLEEAIEDTKNAEWLAVGSEDQWTEGFTEEHDVNQGKSGQYEEEEMKNFDETEEHYNEDY